MKSSMVDARIKMISSEDEFDAWLNELSKTHGQNAIDFIIDLIDSANLADLSYPLMIVHDKNFEEFASGGLIFKSDFK